MGISVISTPASAGAAANPLANVTLPSDGAMIDFAALLSGQLAGLAKPAANTPGTISKQDETQSKDKQSDKDADLLSGILAAQDTLQANQLALSNTPPVQANQLVASDTPPAPADQTIVSETPPTLANQLITPSISPTLENHQSVGINLKPASETNLEAPGNKISDTAPSSGTPKPQANLLSDPMPSMAPALFAASPPNQGEAAILAGDALTGNTAPATFATLMTSHAAPPAQHNAAINTPTISTPLQDNRWAQDFGDRIVWAAKNDQQIAQINITPAQLGPVQITLSLNGDQASIAFASPHAEVRKAIEDAMPNLREMLSTAGISLGQSNVGAQLPQQQRDSASQFANGARSAGETAILPADSRSGSTSPGLPIQRGRGLVDLFA